MTRDPLVFAPKWLQPDVRVSHARKMGITGGVQVLPDGVEPLADGRLFVVSGSILWRSWADRDAGKGMKVVQPDTEVSADHQVLILLRDIQDLRSFDRGDAWAAGKTEHQLIANELPQWQGQQLTESVKNRIRADYPIIERDWATWGERIRDQQYR